MEREERMFKGFDKITTIPVGTRFTVSQIGYYNFWYPSSNSEDHGILSESVSGMYLSWRGGGEIWIPYQVTDAVAKRCGSPIRVIWVYNEDLKNG